jgi:hypothetical protein
VGVQTFRPELPRYDLEIVSRHNDLNPNDILFDGARVWIVDWEGAFAADHYVDLAALANFMTPADLMPLRTIYFAAAPSRAVSVRPLDQGERRRTGPCRRPPARPGRPLRADRRFGDDITALLHA